MLKQKILISIGLILAVTFISFYPSLKNGFVNWDDQAIIIENKQIQNLSWQNIKSIFTSFSMAIYYPLVLLSYALEYYFFLLNPLVYHLNNLVLHLFNSLLVFWIILLLSHKISIALVTATLFGIHPLHTESVAWVTERKDVLYSLFFLGALVSYIYYRKNRGGKYYFVSLFLFVLSLFSKSMAITLPLILFLIDYIINIRFDRKNFEEKMPFLMISILFTVHTLYGLYISQSLRQAPSLPSYCYIFLANYGLVFYLFKLIAPIKLSSFYPYPQNIGELSALIFLIAPAITAALTGLVISSRKYTKKIIFGSLFFLITILPVIQILPSSKTMAADRYTYIPLLGLFYIAGEYFYFLYVKKNRYYRFFILIILIAIIGSLSFLTFHRCQVWKDSITLWNDVLKNYPKVELAYNSRGTAYFYKDDYERAIADYTQAIKIYPFSEVFYNNRANAYIYKREYGRSISDYTQALRINPDYALAYHGRGFVYAAKDNYERAIADYNRALRIKPNDANVYNKRGLVYAKRGEYERAIADYTQAIKLKSEPDPDYVLVYTNRADAYIAKKEYDRAIADYTHLLSINPNVPRLCYNRGNAYSDKGDYAQAMADYTRAIRINPNYAEAYVNRGNAYLSLGNYDRAIADYTRAIKIKPDLALAYNNRARAYFVKKAYSQAWEDIQTAQNLGGQIDQKFFKEILDKRCNL